MAVAVDSQSNAFVAGHFSSSSLYIGPVKLTCKGSYDIFLAKFHATGGVVWVRDLIRHASEG